MTDLLELFQLELTDLAEQAKKQKNNSSTEYYVGVGKGKEIVYNKCLLLLAELLLVHYKKEVEKAVRQY